MSEGCPICKMKRSNSSSKFTVIAAGAVAEIAQYNPYRVAIVMGPTGAEGVVINFDSLTANSGPGIGVSIHGGPLALNIKDHGDMVRRQWFAFNAGAGTAAVTVFETFLEES